MKKDWKQLLKRLEDQGYVVSKTKNQHTRVTHPDKDGVVIGPGSASDYRGLLNFKSQLKRTFEWEDEQKQGKGKKDKDPDEQDEG